MMCAAKQAFLQSFFLCSSEPYMGDIGGRSQKSNENLRDARNVDFYLVFLPIYLSFFEVGIGFVGRDGLLMGWGQSLGIIACQG